jgi:hypothetical protein
MLPPHLTIAVANSVYVGMNVAGSLRVSGRPTALYSRKARGQIPVPGTPGGRVSLPGRYR